MQAEAERGFEPSAASEVGGVLPAAFFARAEQSPDRVAMRRKRLGLWEEISWSEYREWVRALAMVLIDWGVKAGEPVGLISENRAEWLATDLAVLAAGGVTCAMYTTSAVEQVAYIMDHAAVRVVIVEDEEQLDKLLEVGRSVDITRIVVMDNKGLRRFSDPRVVFFDEVLEQGRALLEAGDGALQERLRAIVPDDLAILVYTSGTTGPPKGVMLSHRNIVWVCGAVTKLMKPRGDDELLSFLPLCHIAERTITVFNQVLNGTVVNFAENLDTVSQNLAEVRPEVFFAVPRIWEKMYNAVELRMTDASWGKRRAYARALALGKRFNRYRQARVLDSAAELPPAPLRVAHWFADAAVLRPLRKKLGLDRVRFAISGAAPISADVIDYFQALGVPLVEGYGQTESSAIITLTAPGFAPPGTVGEAADGVELRIAADGEILARSPGVMLGYFREPEATAAAISDDGWLHTGDVGELDEHRRLRITDRKKDLIITAGGKNIAPQLIESKLRLSPYIHDAVVIGERRKFVSALVILDEDNLVAWAQEQRVPFGTYAELATSEEVHKLLKGEIDKTNATLTHVEAVKKFTVLQRRLDRDEGELTPTLKVRRKIIEDKYRSLIDQMYA
jgi:long-chain acyl-CoA synthetase